jgi:hypothetical protein
MDPKYEHCSKEERDSFDFIHHSDRVKKALTYIRCSSQGSCSPLLLQSGWISKSILDESLPTKVTNPADVFNVEEDIAMLLSDREDTTSQL